jgi:hypothetical protein
MDHFKKYGVLYAVIFVFAMWLLTPSLVRLFSPKDAIADKGQFGDMYGFVTSLFSGLTIIGLVYTIIQQYEDLRVARAAYVQQQADAKLNLEALNVAKQEIELSRQAIQNAQNEMARAKELTENSTKALTTQNRLAKNQRFDNTFFNMLQLNLEVIEDIDTNEFKRLHAKTMELIEKEDSRTVIKLKFSTEYLEETRDRILPFANGMFQFLKWVCEEKRTEGRRKYLPILFSQFNNLEKSFLIHHFNIVSKHIYWDEFSVYLIESFINEQRFIGILGIYYKWNIADRKQQLSDVIDRLLIRISPENTGIKNALLTAFDVEHCGLIPTLERPFVKLLDQLAIAYTIQVRDVDVVNFEIKQQAIIKILRQLDQNRHQLSAKR